VPTIPGKVVFLDQQYIQHQGLAKEIENTFKGLFNNALMVVNLTKSEPKANKRFYGVDAYFNDTRASNDKGIVAKTVVDHLNTIHQSLLTIRSGEEVPAVFTDDPTVNRHQVHLAVESLALDFFHRKL
jgi:hypothetical protein